MTKTPHIPMTPEEMKYWEEIWIKLKAGEIKEKTSHE